MDAALEYLLGYLQDEFRDHPQVTVRLSPRAGAERSPDLEQDYDPSSSDLHSRRGVIVRTGQREYFFPREWVSSRRYSEVQKLAREIRDALG